MVKTIDKCRLCDSTEISEIWNFGESPLANDFRITLPYNSYPLVYFKCNSCHSVQLKYEVSPEILFKDYSYESPPNLIPHFKELAKTTTKFLGIQNSGRVIDIGSNNGLLLQEFKKLGYDSVVGFEPCDFIAQKSRMKGISTVSEFFKPDIAKKFTLKYEEPELITCTNCFAHIPDLNEFIEALKIIMNKNSYFVFENAYLLNTIQNKDLGQAYFEHIFMHSIIPLDIFFNKHGLELFKVEYNNVQMGSIRGYVRWKGNRSLTKDCNVVRAFENELVAELTTNIPYKKFLDDINLCKFNLINKLDKIKKGICIYGWPAKMTLINKYFGLEKHIDYVVEESYSKITKLAPGTNTLIMNLDFFKKYPTSYCIIGAYNFEKDIKSKNEWYKGEWINPLNV